MAGQDSIPELVRNMRNTEDRAIVTHVFPTKPLPHGLQMIFKDYDYATYASSFQVQQSGDGTSIAQNPNLGLVPERNSVQQKSTGSLELPFPRTLRDSTGVQVTAFERDFLYERLASGAAGLMSGKTNTDILGNIGQFVADSLGAARDLGKAFASKGVIKTLEDVGAKLFTSSGEETKTIAAYLAQKYLSGDLAKTASAALGKVVNPQQTLAFEGVNLREFTFEWELFPANKSDTEKITEIIRFLKQKMLPELNGVAGIRGLERAFLKYPSVVELSLLGVQEKHFVRFKRAMISDVNVDYSGGASQVSIIKGGVPASVTLSITFKELSIQTADDYKDKPPSPGPSTQSGTTTNPENNS